jgi:ATP-dependent DNA ligase
MVHVVLEYASVSIRQSWAEVIKHVERDIGRDTAFELNGERYSLSFVNKRLYSRNCRDLTERFSEVCDKISKGFDGDVLLDGELIAVDKNCRPFLRKLSRSRQKTLMHVTSSLTSSVRAATT